VLLKTLRFLGIKTCESTVELASYEHMSTAEWLMKTEMLEYIDKQTPRMVIKRVLTLNFMLILT
jgi:hypothetical protein